jgi:HAD superfamily hydrolase (TIGR01549 family)
MSPRIKGIFFDLDDTLIRYSEAERLGLIAGCRVAARQRPELCERALALTIYQVFSTEYCWGTPGFAESARLSVAEFRRRVAAKGLLQFGIEDTALTEAMIDAYRDAELAALRACPEVAETLHALHLHFRLGIITNGPSAVQREKIASVALTEWFSEIVVDTEFGHSKPDRRIFDHAARRVGLRADEMIFVGNSVDADCEGAHRAGWTSVWVNPAGAPPPSDVTAPDYTIGSFAELRILPPIAARLKQPVWSEKVSIT